MTILTNVSEVLALLAAGVALLAGARALQVVRRFAQPTPPAPASTATAQGAANPPAPAATGRPATNRRAATQSGTPAGTSATQSTAPAAGGGGSTARGDALREQIRSWLAERSGQSLSLLEVSNGVGRRSATVAYALDKLISAGHVELTSPKPRRYAITSDGAHAASSQPALAEAQSAPEPAAPEQPAEPASTRAAAKPKPRRVAATASVEPETSSTSDDDLREEIRAYLADQPGHRFSLIDISGGIGRASAAVDQQVRRMVEAGQVTLASEKPRRYTIAAAEPAERPNSGATRSSGRRASKATASAPSGAGRQPASRRGARKAAAATGKVAAGGR